MCAVLYAFNPIQRFVPSSFSRQKSRIEDQSHFFQFFWKLNMNIILRLKSFIVRTEFNHCRREAIQERNEFGNQTIKIRLRIFENIF